MRKWKLNMADDVAAVTQAGLFKTPPLVGSKHDPEFEAIVGQEFSTGSGKKIKVIGTAIDDTACGTIVYMNCDGLLKTLQHYIFFESANIDGVEQRRFQIALH